MVTGEIRTPPFAISRAEFKEAPFLRAQIRAFFPQNFIRSFGRLFVGFVEAIKKAPFFISQLNPSTGRSIFRMLRLFCLQGGLHNLHHRHDGQRLPGRRPGMPEGGDERPPIQASGYGQAGAHAVGPLPGRSTAPNTLKTPKRSASARSFCFFRRGRALTRGGRAGII